MTTSNTAAIAASQSTAAITNTEATPAKIKEVLNGAIKPVMELRGLADLLEITTKMQFLPDLVSCSYARRSVILLAHKGYQHIQPVAQSFSALGDETKFFSDLLKEVETIFVILSTPRKLSFQDLLVSLSLIEDAESRLKVVDKTISDRLIHLDPSLQCDIAKGTGTANDYGRTVEPFICDSSISVRFDLIASLAGEFVRYISSSKGRKKLLEHDQAAFCIKVRMTRSKLQGFHDEIESDEFKERIQVVIHHLGFLDKLFANGVHFNASDVNSVNLIAEEIVYLMGELAEEISEFELKQKTEDGIGDTIH